jgi:aspartyl-tRNA(Asn)/glutamyl-tRNA(Gln) amidotransferase subunit B
VVQETRGWDEVKKITESQRVKESAHDYRYFPEPDLPPLHIPSAFDLEKIKAEIPELPEQKRNRLIEEYGLVKNEAGLLVSDLEASSYFEEAVSELRLQASGVKLQTLFNYFSSDLRGLMNEAGIGWQELKITSEHLAHLVALIEKKEITSRIAKDVLKEMFDTGRDPEQIIKEKGLNQISDEDIIKKAAEEVIQENSSAVEDYKNGKNNVLQFLVGKVMAKLKGRGEPSVISQTLVRLLTKK